MGENRNNGPSPFQVKDEHESSPKGGDNSSSINLLDVVNSAGKDKPATKPESAPPVERVSDSTKQPEKAPPVDTTPVEKTRELIIGIQQKMQALGSLYEQKPDGTVKLKEGKVADASGRQVDVAEMHSFLIGEVAKDYDKIINVAERGAVPQVDGAIVAARRDYDQQVNANAGLEAQLASRGINVKDANGILSSVSIENFLKANPNLSAQDRAKVTELSTGLAKQLSLQSQVTELKLLRDAPAIAHTEYARFLDGIGLPNAAAEHMKKAEAWTNERSRPAEIQRVSGEIKNRQEQTASPVVEKYLKNPDNPFNSIAKAHELAGKGDHAGAKAALEEARVKAGKLKPEEIEADLKKFVEAGQKEMEAMKTQLEQKQREGKLTPAEVLKATEREAQINNEMQILQSFLLAKNKTDLAYASYLLNVDPNKTSEGNRNAALDILLKTRYDKYGKIAAAQEAEAFDKNLEKAMSGTQDNQAKLMAYQQAMMKYEQAKQDAAKLQDNDQIAAKLKEARRQAEVAKNLADGIDRGMAHRTQESIRNLMQTKIQEEQAKPAGQRDDGKIRLLQEITKPANQMNPEIAGLLAEAFKDPAQADKAKLAKLEGMVKNKEELGDILAAHSEMTRMQFMKQAVNTARVAVMEIDLAFDDAEDHAYTKQIENDPYGREFIQTLGKTADGKDAWSEIKEATRDLAWYENAWKWFKGNIKDIAISIAAGVSGFVVGTLVGGLSCWSGPGAIIAGGAAGFATGAAVGSGLRAAFGDKITPLGVVLDGVSGMSGGLMGAGRSVALKGGALALESVTGRAVATEGIKLTAGETFAAFKAAGLADKIAIAGGTRFGSMMFGSTLGSVGYRFGGEGVNYYSGKYDNFGDYALSAGKMVISDIPGNAVAAGLGMGFEKFVSWRRGVPMTGPSRFGFGDYLYTGPSMKALNGNGYVNPPFIIEPKKPGDNK